jgi:hypothetical protein
MIVRSQMEIFILTTIFRNFSKSYPHTQCRSSQLTNALAYTAVNLILRRNIVPNHRYIQSHAAGTGQHDNIGEVMLLTGKALARSMGMMRDHH